MPTASLDMLTIALAYRDAGRSVLPIAPGCKYPSLLAPSGKTYAIDWKNYQAVPADTARLELWFPAGALIGIGIACGVVSGLYVGTTEYALEIIDIDDPAVWDQFLEAARFQGLDTLLARLVMQRTPGGAGHLGYCCESIEGNQVLAQDGRPDSQGLVRPYTTIETRGTGGQFVAAPTPPGIHPDNPALGYTLVQGTWEHVPIITPDERDALFSLARSFNAYVSPQAIGGGKQGVFTPGGTRPGDRLNESADADWWAALLEPQGWKRVHHARGIDYWQRPGKNDSSWSATYGATGPYLYVFSSNASPFAPGRGYSPFGAYTLLEHGGDFQSSTAALGGQYAGTFRVSAASNGSAPPPARPLGPSGWTTPPSQIVSIPGLITRKNGDPVECISNILLFLRHHPHWRDVFWWDAVRAQGMMGSQILNDHTVVDIAAWFGTEVRMSVKSLSMLTKCLERHCQDTPRDLLQIWLHSLPPWDQVPRLAHWLQDVADAEDTPYGRAVSRVLPLSMVARALEPGCQARFVVILQGAEAAGKSSLARALAGEEWYDVLSMNLEGKEASMMLAGVWVAELADLDSLSRTQEGRLKAFITQRKDSWIPKYGNFKTHVLRRTIFVGTGNDTQYLKGETGNTRYLPITVGTVDLDGFAAIRDQLFAEALATVQAHPADWWVLSPDEWDGAVAARASQQVVNVYEDMLGAWLETDRFTQYHTHQRTIAPVPGQTSWQEIAEGCLELKKSEWKDPGLQKQITQALHRLGWTGGHLARVNGRVTKIWLAS